MSVLSQEKERKKIIITPSKNQTLFDPDKKQLFKRPLSEVKSIPKAADLKRSVDKDGKMMWKA